MPRVDVLKNKVVSFFKPHVLSLCLLFLTFGVFFCILVPHLITQKTSGVYVGYEHLWSDWPLHIGLITIFAYRSSTLWFVSNPMFAPGKLSYPFLADLVSGMLVRMGLSIPNAIIVPTVFFLLSLLLGMYILFFLLYKSPKKSVVAIFIFLLSSGLGWLTYAKQLFHTFSIQALLMPSQFYTRQDIYEWYSGNVIVGLLLPQRAFLLGMVMTVWILIGVLVSIQRTHMQNWLRRCVLCVSGVMAGLLIIAHIHSFIVLVIVSGLLCLVHARKWRQLLWYVVPAAITSTILYVIFMSGSIANPHFVSILVGWTAKGGFQNWITMWVVLWGIAVPLSIFGLYSVRKNTDAFVCSVGFLCVFILANIVLFQPIHWDNSKLFLWSYLGISGVIASLLVDLSRKNIISSIVVAIVFLSLTATGTLDLLRVSHTKQLQMQINSTQDIVLADQVRMKTSQTAIFLTGTTTNNPIMVWGARPIMMGFRPWVENFGFLTQRVYEDMQSIYAGSNTATMLIQKYHISYVYIGPQEEYEFHPDHTYFETHYKRAFVSANAQIYDVRVMRDSR